MASDLGNGFAIYPMVEEREATGIVAGVYAEVLDAMPFVPSLFKSLAVCPRYLALAWRQAAPALGSEAFGAAAGRLVASVEHAASPPESDRAREVLGRFVDPLGRMLLLSAGLLEAVEGRLAGEPAAGPPPEAAEPVVPEGGAPSQWEAPAPAAYGAIRAALETPLVNSIWRTLAGEGLLDEVWAALGAQVAATRPAADRLQHEAVRAAHEQDWRVVASPAALDGEGVGDAAPALAAILDAYVKTLPRVLTLAASSRSAAPAARTGSSAPPRARG
jgi:hypothetical protein